MADDKIITLPDAVTPSDRPLLADTIVRVAGPVLDMDGQDGTGALIIARASVLHAAFHLGADRVIASLKDALAQGGRPASG